MASLAAEAAIQCFVLAGGAAEADAFGRAAGRLTGNRFAAEEVVGDDARDRSGQRIMVRLAGEADCRRAARDLLLAGKLSVGEVEFPVAPGGAWRAPSLLP
eukprot:9395553-Alexandrium_andersonii.AAC.1